MQRLKKNVRVGIECLNTKPPWALRKAKNKNKDIVVELATLQRICSTKLRCSSNFINKLVRNRILHIARVVSTETWKTNLRYRYAAATFFYIK